MTKPVVAIIGTGGTIGSLGRDSLDQFEYMDFGSKLEIDQLITRFPEIAAFADTVPIQFRTVGSAAIGPRDWLELNELIHTTAAESPSLAGIVLTHGTATLEETAYFLNLTLQIDLPVVVVGAQRPANGLSSDAGMNLLNAIRLAASPHARGLGVLVLLNDEIHAAREVTKTSTLRLETFRAPDLGMLGYVDADGQVEIYRAPTRRHAPDTEFDVRVLSTLPRVDIAYSYAGSTGLIIETLARQGAQAIVSASLAPGLVTPEERLAQERAQRLGVVIVQSSRVGSGRVIPRTRLREERVVTADNLNPQKARVLAMLTLTRTRDPERIQQYFEEY
jgi:L-asparaginase